MSLEGKYDGVAPGAKIAFLDLGAPSSGGSLIGLPASSLYGPARKAGARINTNSWGGYFTGTPYYNGHDVDNYLFNNQVFRVCLA